MYRASSRLLVLAARMTILTRCVGVMYCAAVYRLCIYHNDHVFTIFCAWAGLARQIDVGRPSRRFAQSGHLFSRCRRSVSEQIHGSPNSQRFEAICGPQVVGTRTRLLSSNGAVTAFVPRPVSLVRARAWLYTSQSSRRRLASMRDNGYRPPRLSETQRLKRETEHLLAFARLHRRRIKCRDPSAPEESPRPQGTCEEEYIYISPTR